MTALYPNWPAGPRPEYLGQTGAMAYDRQWIVDQLRHIGYQREADDAEQTLPKQVPAEELLAFADRHGISRDELINRMGGSP